MSDNKDFFIGWDPSSAPRSVGFSRALSVVALLLVLGAGGALAVFQSNFLPGTQWDFTQRSYEGILLAEPIPLLIGHEEGHEGPDKVVHYLVLETKHAPSASDLREFHLKPVRVQGSRIADDSQPVEMIAILDLEKAIQPLERTAAPLPVLDASIPRTLQGEIIDAKCALGAMNPALFKPHRACAIRCISGGIPPLLRVFDEDGSVSHHLLLGAEGQAIHQEVLDYVALPVEVTGQGQSIGDWHILCSDTIRLLE